MEAIIICSRCRRVKVSILCFIKKSELNQNSYYLKYYGFLEIKKEKCKKCEQEVEYILKKRIKKKIIYYEKDLFLKKIEKNNNDNNIYVVNAKDLEWKIRRKLRAYNKTDANNAYYIMSIIYSEDTDIYKVWGLVTDVNLNGKHYEHALIVKQQLCTDKEDLKQFI